MRLAFAAVAFAVPAALAAGSSSSETVQVMIVGTYHMSNPGHDLHNLKADDVLAPKRQAEIEAVNAGLARFRPTKVAAEWDAETVDERYPKYLAGTLPPSRNEVVQLGFRLAKTAGLKKAYGIDADGDFPYEQLQKYAQAHGQAGLLDEQGAAVERSIRTTGRILAQDGISAALRSINDPAKVQSDNSFYRTTLRIGAGKEQPGVDLLTAWYRRNFLICANLIQLSQPGDRIVVFYGSGHAFLLRQCVRETPGFALVEPNDYLPR
jgi:Family of unknown function (DUF5694)